MLADFRAGDTIAATAFEIVVSLDCLRAEPISLRAALLRHAASRRQTRQTVQRSIGAGLSSTRAPPASITASSRTMSPPPQESGPDQARHERKRGNFLEASVAIRRRARNISRIKVRAGGFAEGLRLARHRRRRLSAAELFGDGDATGGTCQPQECNQEPHNADNGWDYGI